MTTGTTKTTSNRNRALHAAIEIAGTQGTHALTHGRVDAAASLPRGSTSNYFRSRTALIHATVDHLVAAEQNLFGAGPAPLSIDDLVTALVAFVDEATTKHRTLTAARFAFFMEGFHDAHVREELSRARQRIVTWAAQILEALEVPRPFTSARRILTHLEGTMLHRLTFNEHSEGLDDIEAVVRSCIS